MPLDTHLHQDLHSSYDYHATISQHLPNTKPRKFDGSTLKRLSSSYHRLFYLEIGVTPAPERISDDMTRVIGSLEAVLDARGYIIDETQDEYLWQLERIYI